MDTSSFITTVIIIAAVFAINAARHCWGGGLVARRARQASRAAKSSKRASKVCKFLSAASIALYRASAKAGKRAEEARSRFCWHCWRFYSKSLLWGGQSLETRAARLLDRAESKLRSCGDILDSLGRKRNA